jgi:hypothetical protein
VAILPALWLWVKTLDLVVSMAAVLCVVTLLRASLWSPDTSQYRFSIFVVFGFLCFSFLYLCYRHILAK